LYNILIELGIAMKVIKLIKMCLNETYSVISIGKNLSDASPIQNGLKWYALECSIRKGQKYQEGLI